MEDLIPRITTEYGCVFFFLLENSSATESMILNSLATHPNTVNLEALILILDTYINTPHIADLLVALETCTRLGHIPVTLDQEPVFEMLY